MTASTQPDAETVQRYALVLINLKPFVTRRSRTKYGEKAGTWHQKTLPPAGD